jgi:hypothetical protein
MLISELFSQCMAHMRQGDMVAARLVADQIHGQQLSKTSQELFRRICEKLDYKPASSTLGVPSPAPAPVAAMAAPALATGTMPAEIVSLVQYDQAEPLPGLSLVSACMNRQDNLLRVLPSWLASGVDEIIIVDWSSTQPLGPMLAHIDDARLRVVRIDDEPRWILTHAFNVGLRLARHAMVFKLDADIQLAPGFLEQNCLGQGEFVRGFWKSAIDAGEPDQRYVNGSFGAFKADLRSVGYYNERILTYGWDDSDLYARLAGRLGRAGRLLAHGSLRHLPQDESQRLENQAVAQVQVLGRFAPTEHENLVNKFHELSCLEWAGYMTAQDYRLTETEPRRWQGQRISSEPVHRPEERDLARVLAMRQLATWRGDLLPLDAWHAASGLEFARLLKQAQAQGVAERLIAALSGRSGLHLLAAEPGTLRQATELTMGIVFSHLPATSAAIAIVADEGFRPGEADGRSAGVLRASQTLVDELARVLKAAQREDLHNLEASVAGVTGDGCTLWRVTAATVAASALAHANVIAGHLKGRFVRAAAPALRTAFATSVYDESNLVRLLEYLACIALNLEVVERLLLMYEARNGLLQLAMQAMCRQLAISPERLTVLPFDRRPTFEELFSVQQLLPEGTLLVVGNADVACDGTLAQLATVARDDHVYVLSRWDIDDTGRSAHLIRLECGIPNVFSADAWIARTPLQADFFLDYPIGSFHCDSFINHQLSRSQRYRWANPCLDVHVFHLHDSRFNSSAEKHVRDQEEIQRRYAVERARNGNVDPVMGAPWCHLSTAHIANEGRFLVNWRAKALVLDMTTPGATLGGLLWLHLLAPQLGDVEHIALVVRLREEDARGPLGVLLARYKQHAGLRGLFIELDDRTTVPAKEPPSKVRLRQANVAELLPLLENSGREALAKRIDELMAWAPEGSGVTQTRCGLACIVDTRSTRRLVAAVRDKYPEAHQALLVFLTSLDRWSSEGRLALPFIEDLLCARPAMSAIGGIRAARVSLITSLFRGGEFLPGYLENVAEAALAADGEVVIVDANCDGHDTEAIESFFRLHPDLRPLFDIVRLERDPGLYACWQLAIERSRGEYISNANLDDRRSPEHTRGLVAALDVRPHLAGAACSISAVFRHAPGGWFDLLPNQVWFEDMGPREFGFEDLYARNDDGSIRSRNIMHCMPVWRRSLHGRHGFFDEDRYGTSADWAFWLKCASGGERFWLEPKAFGRYFVNPDSHNRRNDADGAKERLIIADFLGIEQNGIIKQ